MRTPLPAATVLLAMTLVPTRVRADIRILTFAPDGLSATAEEDLGVDQVENDLLDLRTGRAQQLPDDASSDSDASDDAPPAPKAIPAISSATSPDGKTRIDFAAAKSSDPGTWSQDGTSWRRSGARVNFTLTRDGKVVSTGPLPVSGLRLTPYWSPDSKRVLVVATTMEAMMRAPGSAELVILSAAGPRLEVVANKELLATAGPKVAAALDRAGFVPTHLGPARDAHPTSTVYASKGFEAIAAKMAAAIPGGATVEPLNWKADADVLVAVGNTAK